mmetsp:Transcript_167482/g.537837  ORF Transcript_167482/g.537837 Transcript_167482/m.537837 type:complete len:202 (-) Transcript_167482:479-1084(-)
MSGYGGVQLEAHDAQQGQNRELPIFVQRPDNHRGDLEQRHRSQQPLADEPPSGWHRNSAIVLAKPRGQAPRLPLLQAPRREPHVVPVESFRRRPNGHGLWRPPGQAVQLSVEAKAELVTSTVGGLEHPHGLLPIVPLPHGDTAPCLSGSCPAEACSPSCRRARRQQHRHERVASQRRAKGQPAIGTQATRGAPSHCCTMSG